MLKLRRGFLKPRVIHHIFSNQFYSFITPPNKEDILSALKSAKVNKKETEDIRWNENLTNVKVESLYPDDIFPFLIPSLEIFFQQLRVSEVPLKLIEIWRNTYGRGGHQEIHDHLDLNGDTHLSGCVFLDDYLKIYESL